MLKNCQSYKDYIPSTNKINVMREIILEGPISRADLSRKLGLSVPSVMSLTENLIDLGLVHAVGKGKSRCGKRPELLDVVADSEYYMGVDIGRGSVRIAIMNLCREQVFGKIVETGEVDPAEAFVERLSDLILSCIEESKIEVNNLIGVGIAMPGLIERNTGHVLFSPDFGWNDIPLQNWLQMRLPYTILVENSNRAMALAECQWRGEMAPSNPRTSLCVNLGHGIGGAILNSGRLYYGASGTSGEIGHITVVKDGPLCACGNRGCLEAVASGDAIARQGRDAVADGLDTCLREWVGENVNAVTAKQVFRAAMLGDAVALSIVDKAVDYIGIGLAMAVNILDMDSIVLCGGLTKNGEFFFDKVVKSVKKRQMKHAGRQVSMSMGTRGDYGTAIGAALFLAHDGWRVPKLKHYY